MVWNKNLPAGTSDMQSSDDAIRANWSALETSLGTNIGVDVFVPGASALVNLHGTTMQPLGGNTWGTISFDEATVIKNFTFNTGTKTQVRCDNAGVYSFGYSILSQEANPANGLNRVARILINNVELRDSWNETSALTYNNVVHKSSILGTLNTNDIVMLQFGFHTAGTITYLDDGNMPDATTWSLKHLSIIKISNPI